MEQFEKNVREKIVPSAKNRFDYQEFEKAFSEFGSDIAEKVLTWAIKKFAAGYSIENVVADINVNLALVGLHFPTNGLQILLADKETKLEKEIRATKIAAALLEQGYKMPGVLIQVQSILNS